PHLAREASKYGVEAQQVSKRRMVGRIAHRRDHQVLLAVEDAEDVPADPPQAHQPYPHRHPDPFLAIGLPSPALRGAGGSWPGRAGWVGLEAWVGRKVLGGTAWKRHIPTLQDASSQMAGSCPRCVGGLFMSFAFDRFPAFTGSLGCLPGASKAGKRSKAKDI